MGAHQSTAVEVVNEQQITEFIQQATYRDLILPRMKSDFDAVYLGKKPLETPIVNDDLEEIRPLGSGAFAVVFLVKHKRTSQLYALKVISKTKAVKMKQVEHTLNEKRIQRSAIFPFLVPAYSSFKDTLNLYVVMPYLNGGDLFDCIRSHGVLQEELARFYAAQITLAFEYLHHLELVYRDLKPENIMMAGNGYLKITDFGFVKYLGAYARTWTLCGTPEYIAPEVIQCTGSGKAADWWSFGVLVYELRSGTTPFKFENPMKIFERIVEGKYTVPQHFNPQLTDLIKNLLQVDVTKRYGNLYNGVADIKLHPWFAETNWSEIYYQRQVPPYIPKPRPEVVTRGAKESIGSVASITSVVNITYDRNSYSAEFEAF